MPDTLEKDLKIEASTEPTKEEKDTKDQIPLYVERLDLSDDQKKRLIKEFEREIDAIESERSDEQIEEKITELENQYAGMVQDDDRMQFNVSRNITRPVVDRVVRHIKESFFNSDPIFSITPRPEFERTGGLDVCEKQEDFLDTKIDNLPFEGPIGKGILNGAKIGLGIVCIEDVVDREPRKREEHYEAGMEGVRAFMARWPEGAKKYAWVIRKLLKGQPVNLMVQYKDTIYDDPLPRFVETKNFYCRKDAEGYEGIGKQRWIAEKINFKWWELKQEEKKGRFFDVDKLVSDKDKEAHKDDQRYYESESWDIWVGTGYFALEDKDEPVKVRVYICREPKVVIGAEYYAYDVCTYIPFYVMDDKNGLYKTGLAEILSDDQVAQTVLLNLLLGALYIRNTITPITKNTDVLNQFYENRWTHGIPIEAGPNEVDFLQKYMSQVDINGIFSVLQMGKQESEERAGSSGLMSGTETPLDPEAPASKTMALMQQAGIPLDDFRRTINKSFSNIAYVMLSIYAQKAKEALKYRMNAERITGADPFTMGQIEQTELTAKTNIEAQAYKYDTDRMKEKVENLALFQTLRQEPLVAQNPEAILILLRALVKSWSPRWKNMIDRILPPLEQLKKQQLDMALQGVAAYLDQKIAESKVTGIPLQVSPQELMPMIAQMQAEIATPPPEEVVKARKKANAQPV